MPTIAGVIAPTGNESAGRVTLLEIVDELSRPLDAADTTVRAIAGDAFRAAVKIYNRKGLWPWEITEEDITLTGNVKQYTLQGAVKKELSCHFLNTTSNTPYIPIYYMPYAVFQEKYTHDIVGMPTTYTFPNFFETGQIRFYPVPSTSYSVRLCYYRMTPAPRNEDETVEIPDIAIEAVKAQARFEMITRLPAGQQMFPPSEAFKLAQLAFRELSCHVAKSGDASRSVGPYG